MQAFDATRRSLTTWISLVGLAHVALWIFAVLALRNAQTKLVELVPVVAATPACLVGLWLLANRLFVTDSVPRAVWLLVLAPPVITAGASYVGAQNIFIEHGTELPAAPTIARSIASVARILDGFALGAVGSALVLTFLAGLLSLRAFNRTVPSSPRGSTLVICGIAVIVSLGIVVRLRLFATSLLVIPVTSASLAITLASVAIDGQLDGRPPDSALRNAMDAVSVAFLALGAMGIGAIAFAAFDAGEVLRNVASAVERQALAAKLDDRGSARITDAALAAVPLLAVSLITLSRHAARVGRGARSFGTPSALIAIGALAVVAGLRVELASLTQTGNKLISECGPSCLKPSAAPRRAEAQPEPVATNPAQAPQKEARPDPAAEEKHPIEFGPVRVKGKMFPNEAQGRLELLREDFARCLKQAPTETMDRTINLEFVISEGGGVIYVMIHDASGIPEAVVTCMQMVLYRVGFPSPKRGSVRVYAPIQIRPIAGASP